MGRPSKVEVVNSHRWSRKDRERAGTSRQGLDVSGYRAYLGEFYSSLDGEDLSGEISSEKRMAARQFLLSDSSNKTKQLLPLNLSFFRNLMLSWNQTGTLPPLTDEENAMLSTMYQIWNEHRAAIKEKNALLHEEHQAPYLRPPFVIRTEDSLDTDIIPSPLRKDLNSAASSPFGSSVGTRTSPLSVSSGINVLKNLFLATPEFKSIINYLLSFLGHIEILLKAKQPTSTQARQLVKVFASQEFSSCSFSYLESKASSIKPEEGNTSRALALACLYDFQSRHLRSDASVRIRVIQLYMQAAVKHDSIASMQLGDKYLVKGEGWNIDTKLAFNWYKFSADLNNPIAQHKMGLFYDEGLEGACDVDIEKALDYYTKSADYLPDSMHNIAKIYEDGARDKAETGVDMTSAISMYSVAAARGCPLSQVNLGRLFLLGDECVRRDRDAGKRLLTMAAESGDSDAQMVVGMIHATQAFECFDLPLAEYWLKASLSGGKSEVNEHLSKVQEQMKSSGQSSLNSCITLVSLKAESAKQRGDDFKSHGLFYAAAIEYSNAYSIYLRRIIEAKNMNVENLLILHTSMTSVLIDRLEVILECFRYEDCIAEAVEILSRVVFFPDFEDDKSQPGIDEKIRIYLTPENIDTRCHFFLDDELNSRAFKILVRALVELNWFGGDLASFWNCYTSLSPDQFTEVIRILVLDSLRGDDFAGKCVALLARASSRGKHICTVILTQGALPCLVAVVSSLLSPSSKQSEKRNSESALSYLCCNGCVVIANLIRFLSPRLTSELILATNGHLLLVRLTCSGWEAIVGEQVPSAEQVNCSREGVQALANLAILANEKVWKELLASKCVTAFSAVITGALLDLNKAQQAVPGTRTKLNAAKNGLTFAAPVTDAEKRWMESFTTLEIGINALARTMEVCPLAFSKEIAATPLMQQLQKIFKMDVLPSSLRTNTAFILYSMTCAKDTEASKLLQDGVTRSAIKEILQEHELTLNPGGDRYPWSLEQLFAHVSRGLVSWAANVGADIKGAKSADRNYLVVTCTARLPSLRRLRTSVCHPRGIASESSSSDSIETSMEPPVSFTFDSLL